MAGISEDEPRFPVVGQSERLPDHLMSGISLDLCGSLIKTYVKGVFGTSRCRSLSCTVGKCGPAWRLPGSGATGSVVNDNYII